MAQEKKVFIVDDHPIVRRGLRQLVEGEMDLTVCGEADRPSKAFPCIEEHVPDLVIIDISLKGTSGLELTKQLHTYHPDLLVLVVSLHDEAVYAERALAAGARGYVMKRAPDEELLRAIHQVLAGERYLSRDVQERMADRVNADLFGEAPSPIDRLSDRELEVFRLIGQGFAPRHIAEELSLSVKTVESHRQHLKEKLGVGSAVLLRRYAVAWYKEQTA